eukprot:1160270-Pyramimonas_sp.AAC.1
MRIYPHVARLARGMRIYPLPWRDWPAAQDFPQTEPPMSEVLRETDLIYLRVNGKVEWDFVKNMSALEWGKQPLAGNDIVCMSPQERIEFQ